MKTLLKLGNITIGDVSVSDITIEQEYTAKEVVELAFNGKRFVKELIKELPEVMDDLYTAFEKFTELDKKAEQEIDWEITHVSHSIVNEKVIEIDHDMAVVRHKIYKLKINETGNLHEIAHGLSRLEAMCAKAYIDGLIDIKEYKSKTEELDHLVEQFNHIVRGL